MSTSYREKRKEKKVANTNIYLYMCIPRSARHRCSVLLRVPALLASGQLLYVPVDHVHLDPRGPLRQH